MQPNSIASATRAALVAAALVCLGLCAAISAALSPAWHVRGKEEIARSADPALRVRGFSQTAQA